MENHNQTAKSFREKWENNSKLAFDETLREDSDIYNWIIKRNGLKNKKGLTNWLASRSRILDAGCGNGRVTALLRQNSNSTAEVVGIDLTAAKVAAENLKDAKNVNFQQRDLLEDLSDLGEFDLIYCQEVLHHTADPAGAFQNLAANLSSVGEIAIYVYKLKAPLREYCDDYIRKQIAHLEYDDAILAMQQITELGRVLSNLKTTITVPDVDVLGIEGGDYDLQRFIYHFFSKCFWNNDLDFDSNNAINYDWYHPQLCSRHTLDEVEQWFSKAELKIIHREVDHYGITVRGVKSLNSESL